jgi:hypothetical protein
MTKISIHVKNHLIADGCRLMSEFIDQGKKLKADIPFNILRCIYLNLNNLSIVMKKVEEKRVELLKKHAEKDKDGKLKLITVNGETRYDVKKQDEFHNDFSETMTGYSDKIDIYLLPDFNEITNNINFNSWVDRKKYSMDLMVILENINGIINAMRETGIQKLTVSDFSATKEEMAEA